MSRSVRLAVLGAALAALVLGGTTLADAGGQKVLDSSLVALPAGQTGQTLFGVKAGGLPWQIQRGSVLLFADGRLQVDVQGLVLAAGANAGKNPIPEARAIVTCAGAPAAMSGVVPYSAAGNASINQRVALPAGCLAPAVFFAGVLPTGSDAWFAVTGW